MLSEITLGIPKEVLAILAAIDGKRYSKAVWTLAKHKSVYSLKLFWGVEQKSALKSPNSAHPTFSLVNSHLVNIDKVGIDKVGIDKVGIDEVGS